MIFELLKSLILFRLHVENNNTFPPPLSAEKESEYFMKAENGDKSAKNKIIEHNLRLVAHIVKKYSQSADEQNELISIGTIGLIKAVSTFDYKKGTKFATYASRCIENEILMNFRSLKKSFGNVYINDPVETDKDGNVITLTDLISDGTDVSEQAELMIQSRQLYSFLKKCLDDREFKIIVYRYGLYGGSPHTQNETAEKLKISRSYVSRIEKKAIRKLKDMYDKNSL